MDYLEIENKKRKKNPVEFFMVKKKNEKGEILLSCINCQNPWTPNKHQKIWKKN